MHRSQVSFDYADAGTGQVPPGRISPACWETLRAWLERLAGRDNVTFRGGGLYQVGRARTSHDEAQNDPWVE